MRALKIVSILAVLLLLAANAAVLVPQLNVYQPYPTWAALALGVLLLVLLPAFRVPAEKPVAAEAARPAPSPAPGPLAASRAEAEIVGFLALLQDKGRLVDFLMDDINAYDDGQVGAAARVVHAGCKAALLEHFQISPLRPENEGATVLVPAGYAADEYRLVGKISGSAPFSGVLVHHGWKTDAVTLPRILRDPAGRLPAIAPAEVELK